MKLRTLNLNGYLHETINMSDVFKLAKRLTAAEIYVPKILRGSVPTVKTSSGTRLKTNRNG
ncbi:hypothetical protein Molly5_181 [Maribacter phage Molly_5]|uniref:Uncharacterized protein n=1 Tax=Maribacter phage Molly_1 TaxID=2745685 RepID=A0A8E4UYA6_9CAUD|nr:hypothetical protein M1M29_gp181 [Maribacter phage Molly_1]QQO97679.1 hypothetical protein Molly2_181 [Maribacter phage Molly_2]QQO97879.1 hypothetical protein Molly3_181 [Maribacter phage Molly_3]QQO98079.1 hypothetical protein Molly4_181 [Maribacter phage Molly_4]QQO98279.1 hypothetical protein Molly5_181 [Maribacter phage Molly_5]QQO97479.1 hypothetical protein Molly1_181 [Maribacter phage Molly_1]